MPFEMDAWGVRCRDVRLAEGPDDAAGLGFVAASDRAREVHKKADLRTPYWDWTEREGSEHYRRYAGTAPVHLLFALRKAIDMLFAEGPGKYRSSAIACSARPCGARCRAGRRARC
jgi:alanine-glyoxylate transaminase/serine-glyoxylate transaminase/serine-pyruvate transaminase